nr:MAG TPA: Mannosyl-glycoprotein endo-beta-N-acetylglucosaminidase [Bacteriophage sp.]
MSLVSKKIVVFTLSIFVLCGCSVMTIEGEIKDEFLYYSKGYNQTREVWSDSETNPENIASGVSVNVQFGEHLDNSIRTLVSSGCDVESWNSDNSSNSTCESTGLYLEERDSDSNVVYVDSENSGEYTTREHGESGGSTEGQEGYFGSIESRIVEACNRYGIDSSIVLAIARLETGNFTSYAYLVGNNPGGMSVNEVPIVYGSIEEGVEAMVSNLAHNYFAIGLTTPELIGQKYCPVNPNWANMVRSLI